MRRDRSDSSRRDRAGLTLLELMLTLTLLSLVLGVGLGLMGSVRPGERAAVGLVQNVLRTAANAALARSAPARVLIDPDEGSIEAQGLAVIDTWHFETDDHAGAFQLFGAFVRGGRLVDDGYQGRALGLYREGPGARWEVQVKDIPTWDLREGFSVRMAVRQEEGRDARLLTIGESLALGLTARGGVQAFFVPRLLDDRGIQIPGGRIWLRTEPGVLSPQRWERIEVRYDRRVFQILVEGVLVATLEEQAPVWDIEGPLVVGGGNLGSALSVDNLVVAAVSGEERAELAQGVRFTSDSATWVQFAPGGSLEPTVHRTPARVGLEFEDGRTEWVQVNLYGTVE